MMRKRSIIDSKNGFITVLDGKLSSDKNKRNGNGSDWISKHCILYTNGINGIILTHLYKQKCLNYSFSICLK